MGSCCNCLSIDTTTSNAVHPDVKDVIVIQSDKMKPRMDAIAAPRKLDSSRLNDDQEHSKQIQGDNADKEEPKESRISY